MNKIKGVVVIDEETINLRSICFCSTLNYHFCKLYILRHILYTGCSIPLLLLHYVVCLGTLKESDNIQL